MAPAAPRPAAATGARPRGPIAGLYELLSDPSFALFIIIALAVASILGMVIVDQVPFRGEMARMRHADQADDPLVWLLIHVVPEHPFRSLLYRTLLALLSLSLLACVIKRWRSLWRLAFTLPDPSAGGYDGGRALVWHTASTPTLDELAALLRQRGFALKQARTGDTALLAGSRFGIARLGSVLTHIGFLLLVVGGLIMASTGSSGIAWLGPGDAVWIPGTDAHIVLDDFRVETTPQGQIADYVSSVRLMRDSTLVKNAEIEVNEPLRYRGRSIYQSSYRADPTRVRNLTLVYDAHPLDPPAAAPAVPETGGMRMPPHEARSRQFVDPISVLLMPGQRTALAGTPYEAEIDTFLIDFRMESGTFMLGSTEPRNPAARIRFFAADTLAGMNWYFLHHPEMPVGGGPALPMRLADFTPVHETGLEVATHPGSGWVWAGFAVMTLGTLLSFLLRHERIWVRLQPAGQAWEVAVVHQGASRQDPAFAAEPWETAVSRLAASLVRRWPAAGGRPPQLPEDPSRS